MKKIEKKKNGKSGRPKRKDFVITYEILPAGTLHRKQPDEKTQIQRWEDISDTCAKIISDTRTNNQDS